MSGTKAGAAKAALTNKQRHGDDFYKRIAAKGGKAGTGLKGFAVNRKLASEAGRLGGLKSKRKVLTDQQIAEIRTKYTGGYGQRRQLAKEYGVDPKTIDKYTKYYKGVVQPSEL